MPKKRSEDVINEFLKDDEQRNVLDFIAYLEANKIKPKINLPGIPKS